MIHAVLLLSVISFCVAFNVVPSSNRALMARSVKMHFEEALLGNTNLAENALKPERYIATNRFNVRKNTGPKFEKRWAERKSRLAQLNGFRFFTLLRRVEEFGATYDEDGNLGNYISLTVWEDKPSFDAWRTGDAFKEAHGGGGITDFIQLLSTALFILNGGPKPAFYDGLLPIAEPNFHLGGAAVEGGWRKIEADGENFIPPDIFVAQNRFQVTSGKEIDFENRWNNRESELSKYPGFVAFFLQRRDATKADDGYNYISSSVWKDKESFENWRKQSTGSSSNSQQHGGVEVKELLGGRPKVAFYEGKLTLVSPLGA